MLTPPRLAQANGPAVVTALNACPFTDGPASNSSVLPDYFPAIEVIVGNRALPVVDLLPESFVWAEHQ